MLTFSQSLIPNINPFLDNMEYASNTLIFQFLHTIFVNLLLVLFFLGLQHLAI